MLIDHIGLYFLDNNIICRGIGRLAMPIFAYFIAEGVKYTKNRKKYTLLLLLFGIISQIPYTLLHGYFRFNILITFLISIIFIYLIENFNKNIFYTIFTIFLTLTFILIEFLSLFEYGIFAIALVIVFYFNKSKKSKLINGLIVLLLYSLYLMLSSNYNIFSFIQLCALLSLVILYFYNGTKGKLNLKYLFYTFYPLHFYIILFIKLLFL